MIRRVFSYYLNYNPQRLQNSCSENKHDTLDCINETRIRIHQIVQIARKNSCT